jgi:magnesium-protoporphyrin O-methyltransferase
MARASDSYAARKGELEDYFDRTASDTWKRLTSDQPVSGIRATVRAGRDTMRAHLLDAMGKNLAGRRVLDAGCGTGALSVEAARRGADVLAVDVAKSLVDIAAERAGEAACSIDFRVGDMRDPAFGVFDHVVAMDSLIHYRLADILDVLAAFAPRTRRSILFTFAPRTPVLATMHAVGKLFPRSDRSPRIEPASEARLASLLASDPRFAAFRVAGTTRVTRGFYISQAMELARK